jgi:hypothetical protein
MGDLGTPGAVNGPCLVDADSDGFDDSTDCDDTDPTVNPAASEIVADGLDQDCDGGEICYIDSDLDGVGTTVAVAGTDADCADPGESITTADCNDADATTFPGAAETAGDGVDQDCDGLETCFVDADNDGAVGSRRFRARISIAKTPVRAPLATRWIVTTPTRASALGARSSRATASTRTATARRSASSTVTATAPGPRPRRSAPIWTAPTPARRLPLPRSTATTPSPASRPRRRS